VLAAIIVVYQDEQIGGVTALLKRAFDFKRIKEMVWYLPTLLFMPLVALLSFVVLRLAGTPVPLPNFEVLSVLSMCIAFFISALGEELGWSGFAIDRMQARWGALRASILLGVIWAVFHYIPLIEAHRSANWIGWWSVGTIAMRVIIVWLYNNTGRSVFAAALFHMTINVTWQQFPVSGSYFDPGVSGIVTSVMALVIIAWGSRQRTRPQQP